MAQPLDAGRSPDAAPPSGSVSSSTSRRPSPRPRPSPGPRPTLFPRADAEVLLAAVPASVDELAAVPETDGVPEAELAVLAAAAPDRPEVDVWALVARAQEGDASAFGRLYDHHVTMVHRYVYYRVGDRATAEDVTSETFVRALRRIDSLSFQGRDVGAWLVTIARNIVRDHVKSSRYRLEVTTADMRDADRATDGPEDAVIAHLTNQQLLECVRQLGAEQQECIVLRFLHGLSVAETAEIMGKKDGAIKALQHRAVRRLAGLLPDGVR